METEKVKCLIIGSGPAGYTAAIYAGRANLSPVLYAGLQPGGQLTTTTDVENFPGYPQGIAGPELMEDLRKQAERFGADLRYGVATAANLAEAPYKITIDDEKVIEAETLIIATGAAAKYLGLEDSLDELIKNTKTRRYTYNRLMRMIIHILVGVKKADKEMIEHNEYIRVLGLSNEGQNYINLIKKDLTLPIVSKFTSINSLIKDYEIKAAECYKLLTGVDVMQFEYQNKPLFKEQKKGNN